MKIIANTLRSAKQTGYMLFFLVLLVNGVSGCHSTAKEDPANTSASSSEKQYAVRGKVVSVDAKDGVISLDTEAIPGFMEAMSMAYTLQDPSVASALHAGDKITAQLHIGAQGAVLSDIVVTQQAILNRKPAVQYHVPQVGETVPNFHLVNQNNRKIDMDEFRGKVLILTFIYTRCASSKYCPLMSRNFAALDSLLAANPKLYSRTHLLSVSFDPRYDTPEVLRSYGGAYTGRYTKEKFQHWDFAAPNEKQLASLLQWFDMGVTSSNGTITQHSLSTAVIGPDGKVRYWYPTNTWTAQQVFQDVHQALALNGANPNGAKQ